MTDVKRNKRAKPDPELLKQLTKMLLERVLETEMTEHLGHSESGEVTNGTGNTRNGHCTKILKGDFGSLPLDGPRDRQGTFEPQIVVKNPTRWTGFADKTISLYARGLSVREIQSHLRRCTAPRCHRPSSPTSQTPSARM